MTRSPKICLRENTESMYGYFGTVSSSTSPPWGIWGRKRYVSNMKLNLEWRASFMCTAEVFMLIWPYHTGCTETINGCCFCVRAQDWLLFQWFSFLDSHKLQPVPLHFLITADGETEKERWPQLRTSKKTTFWRLREETHVGKPTKLYLSIWLNVPVRTAGEPFAVISCRRHIFICWTSDTKHFWSDGIAAKMSGWMLQSLGDLSGSLSL